MARVLFIRSPGSSGFTVRVSGSPLQPVDLLETVRALPMVELANPTAQTGVLGSTSIWVVPSLGKLAEAVEAIVGTLNARGSCVFKRVEDPVTTMLLSAWLAM